VPVCRVKAHSFGNGLRVRIDGDTIDSKKLNLSCQMAVVELVVLHVDHLSVHVSSFMAHISQLP
jgi:hypothetical protein